MAIYYINPHTTLNGNGTFASPWSFNTTSRTPAIVAGDEIRVLGVPLSSLLTGTSYTATYTNNYQLTITAGGGLGADFAANDIIYFEGSDTFARVLSVTADTLTMCSSSYVMPHPNTSSGQTNIVIRKVDTATYGPATTSTSLYTLGNISAANASNVTVSDSWVDATTRVTDGSVKTVLYSSSASSTCTFYPGASGGYVGFAATTNVVLDFGQTHVIGTTGASSNVPLQVRESNATVTINQIYTRTTNGNVTVGTSANPISNTTLSIKSAGIYSFASLYCIDCTINVETVYAYGNDYVMSTTNNFSSNLNITFGDIIATTSGGTIMQTSYMENGTITFNGVIDVYNNASIGSIVFGCGGFSVEFGPSFQFLYDRRTLQDTSIGNYVSFYGGSNVIRDLYVVPTVALPPGISATSTYVSSTSPFLGLNQRAATYKNPGQVAAVYPYDSTAYKPSGYTATENLLVTHKDGSPPYEILTVMTPYIVAPSAASFPVVTTDASVFRTSGPSLKSYLQSYTVSIWSGRDSGTRAYKVIKVPCQSGLSYTVTGYIQNNITSFANGDCRMSIVFDGAEVVGQDMTTASNGAWEQFSLTFTATTTAEYSLVWEMWYVNSGSIWLDDLEIV